LRKRQAGPAAGSQTGRAGRPKDRVVDDGEHVRARRRIDAEPARVEVTARRNTWRAHSYVALSASVVGRAKTRAAIEREAASGGYGSTQSNIGRPSARFVPTGLVDCSAHPAVLLFDWAAPAVRASLREGRVVHRLQRARAPAALRLPPGALLYGPQTRAAELTQPGGATESLSVPRRHHTCRHSPESVIYAFANNGAESSGLSSSG
jgi:hypothetical protein